MHTGLAGEGLPRLVDRPHSTADNRHAVKAKTWKHSSCAVPRCNAPSPHTHTQSVPLQAPKPATTNKPNHTTVYTGVTCLAAHAVKACVPAATQAWLGQANTGVSRNQGQTHISTSWYRRPSSHVTQPTDSAAGVTTPLTPAPACVLASTWQAGDRQRTKGDTCNRLQAKNT